MVFGQNFSSISSLIGTLEGEGGDHLESPLSTTRTTISRTNSNGVKSSTTTNTSTSKPVGNDGSKRVVTTTNTSITSTHTKSPQPAATLVSKLSSSALSTFTPTLSRALDDEQSAAKRRRIDGEGNKEQNGAKDVSTVPAKKQLTREEKIAILKKRKMKEKMAAMEAEKAKSGGVNGPSSVQKPAAQSSTGTTTKAPAKGSYAEVLARAKVMQETAVSLQPTKIVHKHHKVEKDKTTWQKKMADKKIDKGKSSGIPESESKVVRKPTTILPPANGKRPITLATSRTQSATSSSTVKKPDLSQPVKRKREDEAPKIEWKGTARGVSGASAPTKGKPQVRERERARSPPRKSYQPRYTYRDDYDETDESDMEAGGLDIEEEEQFSALVATKEDLEAERQEREHQRQKLLAKKKLSGRI